MSDFLQEIEQDVRNEKVWKIWSQYQTSIIWGVAVALALSAVWSMWTWHTNNQKKQWTESFARAQTLLEQGKVQEAMRYFETLENTKSSYAILSSFIKAHFYAQEGDFHNREKAITSFDYISEYKHASPELKEFAKLCSIMAHMDSDQPNIDELLNKVEPLCSEKSFWPLLAQEIKGGLLLMAGKQDEARSIFVSIAKNSDTPAAMRSRAQVLSRGSVTTTPNTPHD